MRDPSLAPFPVPVHPPLIVQPTRPILFGLTRANRAKGASQTRVHSLWEDVLIPGSFEYHRPTHLSEAVALLGQFDSDARLIAGGHSLIPMMKLRLAVQAISSTSEESPN